MDSWGDGTFGDGKAWTTQRSVTRRSSGVSTSSRGTTKNGYEDDDWGATRDTEEKLRLDSEAVFLIGKVLE